MPNHPRANKNGIVLEHIVIAEKKLGRSLEPGEVVHHIDHNKTNNSPDNLMVFETSGQHIMYHYGGIAHQKENGAWTCEMSDHYETCKYCGKFFKLSKYVYAKKRENRYCCMECFRKDTYKMDTTLGSLIKSIKEANGNFSAVGRKYGVSANAIVKRLKSAGLPYHSIDYR